MSGKTITLKPGKTCRVGDVLITAVDARRNRMTFRVDAPEEQRIEIEAVECPGMNHHEQAEEV